MGSIDFSFVFLSDSHWISYENHYRENFRSFIFGIPSKQPSLALSQMTNFGLFQTERAQAIISNLMIMAETSPNG